MNLNHRDRLLIRAAVFVLWPALGAAGLVHSENSLGDDAQLITRHGPLDMRQGDLCVFDSDQGHAWLSNAACVMVMATVTRQRSIHSLEVKQ